MQRAYDEMCPTAEAYRLHREPQSFFVVMIIISVINMVNCKELMMKGVRRQRHTGCMSMMTILLATFILLADMLSNAVSARERMVQEAAG